MLITYFQGKLTRKYFEANAAMNTESALLLVEIERVLLLGHKIIKIFN